MLHTLLHNDQLLIHKFVAQSTVLVIAECEHTVYPALPYAVQFHLKRVSIEATFPSIKVSRLTIDARHVAYIY